MEKLKVIPQLNLSDHMLLNCFLEFTAAQMFSSLGVLV